MKPHGHLILRDYLATDRTKLAIEQAFLSYVRTGLSFLVSGITGFNLFQSIWIRSLGLVFIFFGIATVAWGGIRGYRLNKQLNNQHVPNYDEFCE